MPPSQEPDLALHVRQGTTISAPTSPSKNIPAFSQRANSVTAGSVGKVPSAKDKHKTLLVIDDHHTDWSKYFRGKRIHGDWDIRMEQAEFRDINLAVNSDTGATVSMVVNRNGTKVVRSFRPDFLLIRQHVRDAGIEDYRNLLLGFKYGGVPSVNSLHSLYNFQDKPWVFSQLLHIQRRLGKDVFPLIEQSYFPNHKEMIPILAQYVPRGFCANKHKLNTNHVPITRREYSYYNFWKEKGLNKCIKSMW